MINTNPETIKKSRKDAGLTQTEAAKLIGKAIRTWQQWEGGQRKMDPALFELFNLKVSAQEHDKCHEK